MPKAARKNITPRRTASSQKSSPKSAADRPVKGDVPMKAPGCRWAMWSGVIGLSTTLEVFDADDPVGNFSHLSDTERVALADYMIDLWSQFREDSSAKIPAANNEGQSPFGAFGDVEGGYLRMCAEWHVVRAQQRANWAQRNLENVWGLSDGDHGGELDLGPLDRMKQIEGDLENFEPRTMMGLRQLIEICLAIENHAAVDPEDVLGCGPVVDYLKNIRNVLNSAPAERPIAG
jgi:hypothetical protein